MAGVLVPSSSSSKKRSTTAPTRTTSTKIIYESGGSGGGSGIKGLKQALLFKEQQAMFQRTLEVVPFQRQKNEQELRQTQMWERKGTIHVNVSREDFPNLTADIDIDFKFADAQLQWKIFLQKIKKALEIEYIDRIIDRANGSIVLRLMALVPGGKYYARQSEPSSILDLVSTGKKPSICTYKSLDGIKEAQLEITASIKYQSFIDEKTHTLLSRSMTYVQEFSASAKILKATTAKEIIELVEYFTKVKFANDEDALLIPVPGNDKWLMSSTAEVKQHIDLISLYRLALESLNRMSVSTPAKRDEVAHDALAFTLRAIKLYRDEVDALLLGIKLLTDMAPNLAHLTTIENVEIYWEIMETIQVFILDINPSSPPHVHTHILSYTPSNTPSQCRSLIHSFTTLTFPLVFSPLFFSLPLPYLLTIRLMVQMYLPIVPYHSDYDH